MARARTDTIERLLVLLAEHASAWPALWSAYPALLAYVARHGAWHLSCIGRHADAVAFLGRLRAFELREELMTPQQESAALVDGLAALRSCTDDEAERIDGGVLVALMQISQDRALLRPGCRLLSHRAPDALAEAFAADPNPSAAVAYVLAEEIARRVSTSGDRAAWMELARIGGDHDHAIQYTALYAFKYVAAANPDWLDVETLQPFAAGGPYDRLAATTLLLYLALQGNQFPARFDVPSFWAPRWGYNAEEVWLLRGAMRFRGLLAVEDEDAAAELAYYTTIEARRLSLLERLGPDETVLRTVIEGYWSLVSSLDVLSRLTSGLRHHPLAAELGWLLMVSPYWEVSEEGSALLARFASVDVRWEEELLEWAVAEDTTTWWGALVALRLHAERTGRQDALFTALRVQSRSDSPQLQGNCANTLQTLITSAGPARREELLHLFQDELRLLLHGQDVWAPNEILLMLEQLGEERDAWATLLAADDAPLLRATPDWRTLVAGEWGDILTERLA
jgi:hypothetical protein